VRQVIVIAIGGGGFTHGTDPDQDLFCLDHVPRRPRIGFVGAVGGDNSLKTGRFYDRFRGLAAYLGHLRSGATAREAEDWAAGLDMIYVGGGDPAKTIAHWRQGGIGAVLIRAARSGTVLAGISAGAMCWFESCLWDSGGGELAPLDGLGLVSGSMTPHCLAQPHRRRVMGSMIADGTMPEGYAVEDGAAVALRDGVPAAIYPAHGDPCVYRIYRMPPNGWRETTMRIA